MKRLLLLALLLFAPSAFAWRIVSDPLADQTVTHCGWVVDGAAKVDIPVGTDATGKRICERDGSGIGPGNHNVTATAVILDPVFGRLESPPSAPFAFGVPGVPAAPTAPFRIVK